MVDVLILSIYFIPIYWGLWPGGSLFTVELSDHLGTRIFWLVIFEIWNQPFFWVPGLVNEQFAIENGDL